MTPFHKPTTEDETRFNRSQILARNTVERKYGVWKRRFPCLVVGLRCQLDTSLTVIVACAVLHNFCIQQKDTPPPTSREVEEAIIAEQAVVETTTIANTAAGQVNAATNNPNRQAVMRREKFVQQIASLNV